MAVACPSLPTRLTVSSLSISELVEKLPPTTPSSVVIFSRTWDGPTPYLPYKSHLCHSWLFLLSPTTCVTLSGHELVISRVTLPSCRLVPLLTVPFFWWITNQPFTRILFLGNLTEEGPLPDCVDIIILPLNSRSLLPFTHLFLHNVDIFWRRLHIYNKSPSTKLLTNSLD